MRATLYTAAWVLPVTAPPIRHGAVLVDEGGIIRAVGPAHALSVGDDVASIDLGDVILLPGLVNVHTHPELAGMRGLLEDMPFHRWIPTLRRAKDGAALADADFGVAARWTCLEALAAGVTTIGATEDSGAALDALREAGMRGIVYREVFAPAPDDARHAFTALRSKVSAMRERETDLVRVGASPHAPYTVSDDLFRLIASWTAAESVPLATHAAEAEVEALLVTAGEGPFAAGLRTRGIRTPPRGRSTVELLHRCGLLAARPLLIHCVRVDAEDRELIVDSGAAVAHCPIANARLGHGVAPVVEMQEAGTRVGLGSDSVASNNRIDMLEEARVAQLAQRARLQSASALDPARLLRLATADGAEALGLGARVGALAPGMEADMCAVSLAGAHVRPVIDPVATLFLGARGADVVFTAVRGRVLYRNGRHLTLEPDRLRDALDAMGERLQRARDA
ncbi:MAG TPA: amidohydrolase family protein [Longimicrobiales bacterium]|nr:amidohydrolase family protein [Longimicrobiales bacterium]